MNMSTSGFRVWDSVNKVMHYNDVPYFLYGNGVLFKFVNDKNVIADGCICLRATGMQDSKGNDIFDGDIVQDADVEMRVYYNKMAMRWWMVASDDPDDMDDGAWIEPDGAKWLTVVGNIYENGKV